MILAFIPAPIRRFMAWALAGLVAIAGIWMAGRRSGAVARDLRASSKRADDLNTALDVRTETDAKTDAAVRADLGKWVRPE